MEGLGKSEECLKRISEWEVAEIPGLIKDKPRGVVDITFGKEADVKDKEEDVYARLELIETMKRGCKRLKYRNENPGEETDIESGENWEKRPRYWKFWRKDSPIRLSPSKEEEGKEVRKGSDKKFMLEKTGL